MGRGLAEEILGLIERRAQSRPTPMEFEMAYQARIAIDRIRFAIKQTEQFGPHTDQMREAGLQLLDALDRLEGAERKFERRSGAPAAFLLAASEAQPGNGRVRFDEQDGRQETT